MSAIFPDVPLFPGVPAVFRGPLNTANDDVTIAPLTRDGLGPQGSGAATWGIFDDGGAAVLEPDNIAALEPSYEARVLDYPIEKGGFQSYNKVATPAETRITMTKGGSDGERQAFLDKLNELIKSLDLFSIITPDSVFLSRNLTRYEYKRTAQNGATLLTIELTTVEIRETAKSTFSNSKSPGGDSVVNDGPVQATPWYGDAKPTNPNWPPPAPVNQPTVPIVSGSTGPLPVGPPIVTPSATLTPSKRVPLVNLPAQQLSTTLANQPTKLRVYQKTFGMYADVLVNDQLIIGGVRALNNVPIVQSAYLGFVGDIMFHNQQGVTDPTYARLASQFPLLYGQP